MKGETETLAARKAGIESNKAMLQQDEEGNKADIADFNSVQELSPSQRLSKARRAALLSSEQLLQTIAQMNDVERQRSDYARQLQQIDNQTRIDAQDKLQQTVRQMAELRSTMKGVGNRLALVGGLHTDRTAKAQLSVFRKDTSGSTRISAADDLKLVPRGVVEVAVPQGTVNGPLASAAPVR